MATDNTLANNLADAFTQTIRELIQEEMAASGTQEAAAFNVTVNGVTQQVVSDADPLLDVQVSRADRVRLEKIQSADAGLR